MIRIFLAAACAAATLFVASADAQLLPMKKSAVAEEVYEVPAGVYVNTHFLSVAEETRSIAAAIDSLRPEEQLLLVVREHGSDYSVYPSRTFSIKDTARRYTKEHYQAGIQHFIAIGTVNWVFTMDRPEMRYIALHPPVDKDTMAKPDVYAKVPSDNPTMKFISGRLINKLIVRGKYIDVDTKAMIEFTMSQMVKAEKNHYQYDLEYLPAKKLVMMHTAADEYFVVEWKNRTMYLKPCTAKGTLLKKPSKAYRPVS